MTTGPSPIEKGAAAMGATAGSAISKSSSPLNNALSSLGITKTDIANYVGTSGTSTAGGPSGVTTRTTYTTGSQIANINTIWRQYTGKDASTKQVNAITAAINAAMQANPDKSTNTGGDYSTTSKVVGADPNEIIKQQALQDPSTPSYQAATTYYDAMMQAIKGPLGGGY